MSKFSLDSGNGQSPRRSSRAPWMFTSAIGLVVGLAQHDNPHDAVLMGLGYLVVAWIYQETYRRR